MLEYNEPIVLNAGSGRFARFEAIQWWDQSLLKKMVVLIAGAGALGNEVIKNCALLGIGNCVIIDNDRIEQSNLSRSVLFRIDDENCNKAFCAAKAARSIYPDLNCIPISGNILSDVGLGLFNRADMIISAVDNREARLYINRICAMLGKPWIDGGIDVLNGIVRGFHAPETACYECTMGKTDWDLINSRRSCSLLARQAAASGGTPTTPTTASIIGGLQVQEMVKYFHKKEWLKGRGFLFEGLNHSSSVVTYPVKPGCIHHDGPVKIMQAGELKGCSTILDVWEFAKESLGGCDALDIEREMVSTLTCLSCGNSTEMYCAVESLPSADIYCPDCHKERTPE
jgi:adenylyltransferase/sulfurtransferase